MEHLKSKLNVPAFEWRRVLKVTNLFIKFEKSLQALEYLLKNGPPRVAQDLRNDMYKL